MNWRKPALHIIYRLANNKTFRYLSEIKAKEMLSIKEIERIQNHRLEKIVSHSYKNVPYYNSILSQSGIIENNQVNLENFYKIPILTKDIIRKQKEQLYSRDYQRRKWFSNTSGGSTGEPVTFIQDRFFKSWGMAHQYYFPGLCTDYLTKPLIKLWGSERDVFKNSEKITTRLEKFLFNTTVLNSFKMSESNMLEYSEIWNRRKPQIVYSYTSSIFELAKFIARKNIDMWIPKGIYCTAETLTNDMRSFIEEVFKCPVMSQYGSREVGIIASECNKKEGLHLMSLYNKLEILRPDLSPCPSGEMGDIYITTLTNYSMPLIRYKIGDTGIPAGNTTCCCGRGWPLLASVTGRSSDHFLSRNGNKVHGEYFTHLFYNTTGIKQFQVIQHDLDHIEVLVVPDGQIRPEEMENIRKKIILVLGDQCKVAFNILKTITPSKSGKYRYTISHVSDYSS